jgi:tetratricopeptide (TPR) repeat protein
VTVSVALALVLVASGQNISEDARKRTYDNVVRDLSSIPYLLSSQKYTEAEDLARLSIAAIDRVNTNSHVAHVALGKALFLEGRFDDAYCEFSYGWRAGRNDTDDLLFVVLASYTSVDRWQGLGWLTLQPFFKPKKKNAIVEQVGDFEFDAYHESLQNRAGIAAMLYAAEPAVPQEEALIFVNRSQALIPNEPRVYLVKGMIEARMHRNEDAIKDLTLASTKGPASVSEKAKEAISKIGH